MIIYKFIIFSLAEDYGIIDNVSTSEKQKRFSSIQNQLKGSAYMARQLKL